MLILKRFGVESGNAAALQVLVVDVDEKETGGDKIRYGKHNACHKIGKKILRECAQGKNSSHTFKDIRRWDKIRNNPQSGRQG